MSNEYEVGDGCTLHHYREDDWYVTVDADWWREHYLMCDEGTRLDVVEVYYEDLRADFTLLEEAGLADGPYGEGDTFDAFTGNHENAFNREMIILAGNVKMSQPDAWRTRDSDIVRALVTRWVRGGGNLADMYDHYVVAIGKSDAYGSTRTTMDVYCDPNLDDAYDVTRWEPTGFAYGLDVDVDIDGPNVYPRSNRPPMYDASACEWDNDRNVQTIDGEAIFPNVAGGNADGFLRGESRDEYLVCGDGGVFYVSRDADGAWNVTPVYWHM